MCRNNERRKGKVSNMGERCVVNTSLWRDSKFRSDLKSFKARYLWLYLLTTPHSQSIGIFEISIEDICYETKLEEDEVKQFLMQMTDLDMLDYDTSKEEIIIYNYPKYNISSWGKPMVDKINSEISRVKNTKFIARLTDKLKDHVEKHPNDKKSPLLAQLVNLLENALTPIVFKGREDIGKRDTNKYNNIDINNNNNSDTSTYREKLVKEQDELECKTWEELISLMENYDNEQGTRRT